MPSTEERLARLEAKVEGARWWRNPAWWGVIVATVAIVVTVVNLTKPWEWFREGPPETVKLEDVHAAAFTKDQWSADLRVVNGTSSPITVERVLADFGGPSAGHGC